MALDLFPALIGQGFLAEKAPVWSTAIAEATSGRERRRKLWSYPRWRFKLTYDVLRDIPFNSRDLKTLYAFFNAVAGRYAEFAFFDTTDHQVTGQYFGTGDGTTTQFQLLRTMNYGGFTFTEPVRFVDPLAITIFLNGFPTLGYTIDDYGVVTFAAPPGNMVVITWDGYFSFHVRFDQDDLSPSQMMQQLWSLDGLQMITVKR